MELTREQAIAKLEALVESVVDREMIDETCHEVIGYLKVQEPVEPLRINHDTKWQRDIDCLCGECGGSFYRLKVNFCPWCGKEVKWQ